MTIPADDLIAAFCSELHPSLRARVWITKAESEGYRQMAKLFRAVVKSETIREHQYRQNRPDQAAEATYEYDYFVCPECGQIFELDAPEVCPVDQTPGARFERIG